MKEKIYTIPVTEAFSEDCECPLCLLEKRLEEEYVNYFLGPSLMEPDCRMETNDKGFCRRHGELLYNRQENRLGLALTLETHLREQLGRLSKIPGAEGTDRPGVNSDRLAAGTNRQETDADRQAAGVGRQEAAPGKAGLQAAPASRWKGLGARLSFRSGNTGDPAADTIDFLKKLRQKCALCSKLNYTMDRYMDVIMYLWNKEEDFRKLFESKKGFCLKHMEELLEASQKYLDPRSRSVFAGKLLSMQLENLERIRGEIEWFTKKFDYRNNDAPWGNSKDAVPRTLQKLYGYCDLK